jgi:integrase/recombinase XerD
LALYFVRLLRKGQDHDHHGRGRGVDLCRMVKRRNKAAGLPVKRSPHSFRVATVTDPRTTGLDDRRKKSVTRKIVDRISI